VLLPAARCLLQEVLRLTRRYHEEQGHWELVVGEWGWHERCGTLCALHSLYSLCTALPLHCAHSPLRPLYTALTIHCVPSTPSALHPLRPLYTSALG
jgi:hypothetical protein